MAPPSLFNYSNIILKSREVSQKRKQHQQEKGKTFNINNHTGNESSTQQDPSHSSVSRVDSNQHLLSFIVKKEGQNGPQMS
jgi:hypothetical protein